MTITITDSSGKTKKVIKNVKSDKEVLIWQIGSDELPASEEDVDGFCKALNNIVESDSDQNHIVCHHAVNVVRLTPNKSINIWRVGSPDRIATEDDIENIVKNLESLLKSKDKTNNLVTHHLVNVQTV